MVKNKKLLLVALTSMSLVACADPASQKQRADTAEIEAVLMAYRDANVGFIKGETNRPETGGTDYLTYRQQKVATVVGQIEPLMSKGTPAQQAAMRRIVSDAHASAARQICREAMLKAAAIGPQSAETLSFVLSVEASDFLGKSAKVEENPRQQVINTEQANMEKTLAERRRSIAELKASERSLNKTIADLKVKQDETILKAQAQRDQAFVIKGPQQVKAYTEAEATQQQADRIGADIERTQADLQIVSSQIKIVETEVTLLGSSIEQLKEASQVSVGRQQESNELVEGAGKSRLEASEELAKRFEALAKAYSEQVDAPMAKAHQRMQESAKLLEAATNLVSGPDRNAMKLDLLRRQAERAYLYAQHIYAAGSYIRAVEVIESAADRLPPDRSSYYRENREATRRQVEQLGRQAQQVIAEGVKLATDLNPNGGDTTELGTAATEAGQRLRKYASTVATVTGVKPQDASTPAAPAPEAAPAPAEPAAS